jgi:tRNA-dihydrouridine synthase B
MLKIGSLDLESRFILAPMAGVSDLPFRLLNRRFSCELAFVEMINCRSLGYKSRKTREMLRTTAQDKPLGVQILGQEPAYIQRALDILKDYEFDLLDFNAACPEKKVVKRGEGASLLKDPKKLNLLLKIIVQNVKVPVTVKIRSGWDKDALNLKDIALYAQDAGIKALFIHGRTKLQQYSGSVDYEAIKQVKKALKIPVIASGDIFSSALAKKMFDETGCDGVLVARGALGNPWIFRELEEFFKNGKTNDPPSREEIIKTMIEHLNLCVDWHGPKNGVVIFRKFFSWYTKGLRKIRYLRNQSNTVKTRDEMAKIIEQISTPGILLLGKA